MAIFRSYLTARRRGLLAAICVLILTGILFTLYALPMEPFLYLLLLFAAGAIGFCAWDFSRFRRRRQALAAFADAAAIDDLSALPAPDDALEADYQLLLRALLSQKSAAAQQQEARMRELAGDYGLWTHQIKTPIAAMNLILQQQEQDPERAELSEQLFRISSYVDMALNVIRIDDASDYVITRVPLDGLLRQTIRAYARSFIRKRIRLDYRPTDAVVLTDGKWLSFMVGQLLANALKYTPAGGSVTIYTEAGPERQRLCIADTGIGIDAADLPRVFERGFTGYNGRDDDKATGLGLYLCRRIAERLGHDITITSVRGGGTRIVLDLAALPLTFDP